MVAKDLTKDVLENAAALKIKIEKYYEQLGKQNSDRQNRYGWCLELANANNSFPSHRIAQFEAKLDKSGTDADELKDSFVRKELEFLRLKRVKMSVEDFQVKRLNCPG